MQTNSSMKKVFFAILMMASVHAMSQAKPDTIKAKPEDIKVLQQPPVQLTRVEVDSVKSVLGNLSQRIQNLACLSQGDAAVLQQLLGITFSTILRKERDANEPPKKPK